MFIEGTRIENLENRQFHYLTVLGEWRRNENNKRIEWLCQCKCGNKVWVLAKYLKNGDTKSCGCYNKEKIHERSFKDLTGKKFGRLTILDKWKKEPDGLKRVLWKCRCDCGKELWVLSASLLSGNTQSCGCLHKDILSQNNKNLKTINLIGQKFGKLIVLDSAYSKDGSKYWKCQCECGNIAYVRTGNLKSYNGGSSTLSCGCIKSKGEEKISKLLNNLNISFQKQYSFNNLKDKGYLRFDFAIFKDDNLYCLVEYQGEQHYDKTNNYYSEDGIYRDNLKKKYCLENNIKLIEIPYWDYDKLNEEYLSSILFY